MAIEWNLIEEEGCLHRFYKIVLGWDYLRLLKESSKKNKTTPNAKDLGMKQVKDTYKDVYDYLATFEPLLFEEVKAQIVQGKDEEEAHSLYTTMSSIALILIGLAIFTGVKIAMFAVFYVR